MTAAVPLRRQPGGAYLYDLPGETPYREALQLMGDLAGARSQGAVPDTVIVCEHPPTVTLGASSDEAADLPSRASLEDRGIAVVPVDRGGRATYHGPGQLVCYPILDLADYGRDLRAYVERLEQATVAALADLGVPAEIRDGAEHVGVWTPAGAKIASIGIHVSRWITTHGLALNVSCDLEPFTLFVPCGLPDVAFTTIERETGRSVSREEATAALLGQLATSLGLNFEAVPVGVKVSAGITIFASDLAASRAFYEGLLGLTVLEQDGESFTARRGDLVVTVEGGAHPRKRGRRWMQEAGLYLTIRTDDFDALQAELAGRGAVFLGAVAQDPAGKRFSGLHDPDGVLIELAEA